MTSLRRSLQTRTRVAENSPGDRLIAVRSVQPLLVRPAELMLRELLLRRLRLGVGSHGSIPWRLLVVLLAFVVLLLIKFCSLGLGNRNPSGSTARKGKVVRMNRARKV